MSTSDLYHIWGVKGFTQLPSPKYEAKGTPYKLEPQAQLIRCPDCGSADVIRKGAVKRTLRGPQVGDREAVFFEIDVPKVKCKACGTVKQIAPGIADPKKSYTRAFAKAAMSMLFGCTVLFVSVFLGVSWNLVNSVLKDWLEKKYRRRDFKYIKRIGIDETGIGKGHKYVTIVVNLDTGEPVFVGDGKAEKALEPFWELLGKRRMNKIKAVAMDMSNAYRAAVEKNLPGARIVFDKFHVVRMANKALDDLRIAVCWDPDVKSVVWGSRYLLLKNPEHLAASKNEPGRLERMLALNEPLSKMYILKEDLRQFWQQKSVAEAEAAIDAWVNTALSSGVKTIERLGKSIAHFKEGILAYYEYPITSGMLEGLNNKIKTLVKKAYGYRDMGLFKLLILAIREFDPKKLHGGYHMGHT